MLTIVHLDTFFTTNQLLKIAINPDMITPKWMSALTGAIDPI
jgi:hypothetical protein